MMRNRIGLLVVIPILMVISACMLAHHPASPVTSPNPEASQTNNAGCPASLPVAFKITRIGSIKVVEWYPTSTAEAPYAYSPDIYSSLAKDGQPLTSCRKFPLVIFSHGLGGCTTQSIFFTETLARSGYVVVAPDHQDALSCHVDGMPQSFTRATEPPIMDPKTWTDASYVDRKNDIEAVLNGVLSDPQLGKIIDIDHIGIAGHSLGGYTAQAIVGGWPGWFKFRCLLVLP